MKTLDPTWWRRHSSGEFYEQQNDAARLVKRRTGRRVTAWILYISGEYRGEWSTLAEAKEQAKEITSRVAHGLHPEPGPHCVRCSKRLTPAEVASQLPDHDEFCDGCLEKS